MCWFMLLHSEFCRRISQVTAGVFYGLAKPGVDLPPPATTMPQQRSGDSLWTLIQAWCLNIFFEGSC